MKFLTVLGMLSLTSASPFFPLFFLPLRGPSNPGRNNIQRPTNPGLQIFREAPADSGFLVGVMSEELIDTLRTLAKDPATSQHIDRAFSDENMVCLKNMDEAIEAIQEGTRLFEAAQPNLDSLNRRVKELRGLTGEAEVLRQVASIFRALEPLLKKLAPSNPASRICSASPDRTQAFLRSLAVMMHELSEDTNLAISPEIRGELTRSGVILSTVTSFLRQLISQSKSFPQYSCVSDKESVTRGILTLGNIISSLADMTDIPGNYRAGEEMRKGSLVIDTIVVSPREIYTFISFSLSLF